MTWEQPPALTVCGRRDGGEATVTVRGEIDLTSAAIFAGHLDEVIRQNPQRLVIDMAEVRFIDSSGLHALIRVRAALPERCPIILRSAQHQVRQVFEITELSSVFDFE